MRVAAISGSLRKASFNTALLRAAQSLAPEGMSIEQLSIAEIPPYDEDVKQAGFPANVQALRSALASADAVLFVTPEYNYSVPGVLKNAIDWASRPPHPPLVGKPGAIMSASIGGLGGARAQYHLRQICVFLEMHLLNRPEVFVGKAREKFDAELRLTDETTQKVVRAQLEALAAWTARLAR